MSLADEIECVRNEVGRRKRTYPALVRDRQMTPETAELELARMMAVLGRLQRLFFPLESTAGVEAQPPQSETKRHGDKE